MAVQLPEQLQGMTPEQLMDLACKGSPSVWARVKRGFVNAPFHEEWYRLVAEAERLCVVAPREHAKTEVFTVNATAWRSIFQPGLWTYIFSQTKDQAQGMKERIDLAIEQVEPRLTWRMPVQTKTESVYRNGARVTVAGAGKAVRSAHPDIIIGDDVLDEDQSRSSMQRQRQARWWLGTVSNMAHPGTHRFVPGQGMVWFAPTKVFLVGTPFHGSDLLMQMKQNPMYVYRRYAAEFHPTELVDGWAVEVG